MISLMKNSVFQVTCQDSSDPHQCREGVTPVATLDLHWLHLLLLRDLLGLPSSPDCQDTLGQVERERDEKFIVQN